MNHRSSFGIGLLCACALGLAVTPRAEACGGFFCQSAPMNQAGENILFSVEDDGSMTAYVQILYQGEADAFAWILPLPSVPQLSVGTDQLFLQLGNATRPQFRVRETTIGACRTQPRCHSSRSGFETDDLAASPSASADAGASPGVMVEFKGAVGPYDAVVLSGGTADELYTWLVEHGFRIPESSRAAIADYVARRHYFVAIRLLADRTTTEIQPLVLRYREAQPCVPIELTAIATVPDMPITAYFLANGRATPANYATASPELDDPGLWTGATSYSTFLTRAVDAAGGQAFMTEYAGDVPRLSLTLPSIDDLNRADITPGALMRALVERGYRGDAQLLAILTRWLPPPTGVDARGFYNCLARSGCQYDGYRPDPWEPIGLVEDVRTTITEPRAAADALLGRHPWLTRLGTTMSASEMTLDPTFRIDPALGRVSNVHEAERRIACSPSYFAWSAPTSLVLPTGRVVQEREGVPYGGTDAEYCMDLQNGMFYPGAPIERLRQTSMMRGTHVAGGALTCSAGRGGAGALALGVLGLGVLGLARRRRAR